MDHQEQENSAQRLQGLLLNKEHKEILDLSGTGFTDEQMPALSGSNKLACLKLSQNAITDAGLTCLDGLPSLIHLDLGLTRVALKGDAYGCGSFPVLPALEWLNLSFSSVNNVSVLQQLRHKTPGLRHLILDGVRVFGWNSEYLSELPANLLTLNLSGVPISTHALERLQRYKSLIQLTVRYCQLDEEHLAVLGGFEGLKVLQMGANHITEAQMAALRKTLRTKVADCIVTT